MPLYAYRCTQCGHRFEKIQSFSSTPEQECPLCKGLLERPLTAPGLHFKGAGWYVNDYASKSSSPSAGAKKETASTEAKAPATVGESASSVAAPTSAPAAAPGATSD